MSRPTEVLVKVKDLEYLIEHVLDAGWAETSEEVAILGRLKAAIPEPEWAPTEEQIQAYARASNIRNVGLYREPIERTLRAFHREGLM